MTQAIIDALSPFCDSPPSDLVTHFARETMPEDPNLSINLLPLPRAIEYTKSIQQIAILGEPFRLVALDDANNSNPYCYVGKGPTRGCIMHLYHDGDPRIAFASLKDFLDRIDEALMTETNIYDLPHDETLASLDRTSVSEHVTQLAATGDDVEEICVLIPLLPTADARLITILAQHTDFFVREAVAERIANSPTVDLLSVAQELSSDQHPQVARPGRRALSAVNRAIYNP